MSAAIEHLQGQAMAYREAASGKRAHAERCAKDAAMFASEADRLEEDARQMEGAARALLQSSTIVINVSTPVGLAERLVRKG